MDGIKDEEEVGNVDSEHESVSSEFKREDGNLENTEVEKNYRNTEQSETHETE
jgi:hypothetical protein